MNGQCFSTLSSSPFGRPRVTAKLEFSKTHLVSPLERLLLLTARLKILFEDPTFPPDLEFGAFRAVHGPLGTRFTNHSLVRIDISRISRGKRPKSAKLGRPLILYCLAPKDVVCAMMDLPGNDARIALLSAIPGVSLVEREGLPADAIDIVNLVLQTRR